MAKSNATQQRVRAGDRTLTCIWYGRASRDYVIRIHSQLFKCGSEDLVLRSEFV